MVSLDGCSVQQITPAQAKRIILVYEWLGNMGKPSACYGLIDQFGDIAGVVTFGNGPHATRRKILDEECAHKIICLERGACTHWAHEHAASFLISRAVKLASRNHGWELFYAYSDPAAGEIGTVYQASNWLYLGQGPGKTGRKGFRAAFRPPGVASGDFANYRSTRILRNGGPPFNGTGTWAQAEILGWIKEMVPTRHLYIWPAAKRRYWLKELEKRGWQSMAYPKRHEACMPNSPN